MRLKLIQRSVCRGCVSTAQLITQENRAAGADDTCMNKDDRARIREEATQEAREDEEKEMRIERRLRRWKRGTIWLGVALMVSVGSVVPFSQGHSLYRYSGSVGKSLVYLSMCLLCVFMYAAGTTYNFWSYLRAMKRTHRKFAPPGSKYRTGK
jgi:hypothetical protein